ncbi:hypothetical protein FGG08_004816 [Glutinoglossum americanum]|uniref:UFSP1/2/DUB catalytic domain-containing protein n=1 Tax=Glutinoglossum americanum TaxID=1670608 RepID=A0A9P8IAN3_9PEZI|nr:hypothetical protein FGG08_004816 [Glutinoglossum americanum]
MDSGQALQCPFCGFGENDAYSLMLHVETFHSEGESPFVVRESDPEGNGNSTASRAEGSEDSEGDYVDCPEEGCGESVPAAELQSHIDLHFAEKMTFDEAEELPRDDIGRPGEVESSNQPPEMQFSTDLSDAIRNPDRFRGPSSSDSGKHRSRHHRHRSPGWRDILGIPSSRARSSKPAQGSDSDCRRLGKAELGPHANEDQMPAWLRKQLEEGGKVTVYNQIKADGTLERVVSVANETKDMVPLLAQLCEQDQSLEEVFLCHPGVKHVVKMWREGGFCGYRNIQMLISYIQAAESQGFEHFPGRLPTILNLQDLIEEAWDKGINTSGRVETGGIKGTRKYIGTPEAQALFISLGIDCEASAFSKAANRHARDQLLQSVEEYFTSGCRVFPQKVHRTLLPPLYLQHRGHSLTIVGLEKGKSGGRNLLVFDPMFKPSPGIFRLLGRKKSTHRRPGDMLRAYRRGEVYLRRYSDFELLRLSPPESLPASTLP